MCCEHGQSLKHAKKKMADTKGQALYDFLVKKCRKGKLIS